MKSILTKSQLLIALLLSVYTSNGYMLNLVVSFEQTYPSPDKHSNNSVKLVIITVQDMTDFASFLRYTRITMEDGKH